MTTALMPEGRQRYFNNDGTPAAGGKLYTYAAGTTTPKVTYSDEAGTAQNTNPIVLDAKGEAVIYWNGAYKVDLLQADDQQVTGYPVDNYKTDPAGVWGILTTFLAMFAAYSGSSLIGFIQAGAGAVLRTIQDKLRDIVNRADYNTDAAFDADKVGKVSIDGNKGINAPGASVFQEILVGDGGVVGITDSVVVGRSTTALTMLTTGYSITAMGYEALKNNTTGFNNTALGRSAMRGNVSGVNNTAVGVVSLEFNTTGGGNTGVGVSSLVANTTGSNNTGLGFKAGFSQTSASGNTAVGTAALQNNVSGSNNVAVGYEALILATGQNNVAVGMDAGVQLTTGSDNVGIGKSALYAPGTGNGNVGVGSQALTGNANYNYCTAIGYEALRDNITSTNTGVGRAALAANTLYSNVTGLGANTAVTAGNQVQLGDSATTTYVYGTVQNRSDARDKADVRETVLGLDFINALRPVDFRWDFRSDYCEEYQEQEGTDAEGMQVFVTRWRPLPKDGSKKRIRFHHGLVAQEVKATCDALGVDFGGYQDHAVKGGEDVLSIGYDELFGPLIKAIQQLSQQNDELRQRLDAAGL